jgi:hypothetical protein
MARPPEAPFASTVIEWQPHQHFEAIFSRISEVHLVSWINMMEEFFAEIKALDILCLPVSLRPLKFQEVMIIGKARFGRKISSLCS